MTLVEFDVIPQFEGIVLRNNSAIDIGPAAHFLFNITKVLGVESLKSIAIIENNNFVH